MSRHRRNFAGAFDLGTTEAASTCSGRKMRIMSDATEADETEADEMSALSGVLWRVRNADR
jgi:hypothetical protein